MGPSPPLSGLKVVEFARILAGPWAGQILADLGADVVKVESPNGDDTRRWGPPFLTRAGGQVDAAYFHATNRNKRSVIIDFATGEGQREARELAAGADVVIENFKVGDLARYGLDYPSLAPLNPELVYCSITGFGQDGPYASRAGYDFIVQGLGGIMDLTGDEDGDPQKIGVAYADIMTGLYATIAIQAALAERSRSGLGQHIDMALLDVIVGTLANQAMNYLVSGDTPHRLGNAHPNIAPYEAFEARDGWLIIAVGNDKQFSRCCEVLGIEAEDRWRTNADRVADRAALSERFSLEIQRWDRDDLIERLVGLSVPAGPVNDVAQAFANPQVQHRALRFDIGDETGISVPAIRLPIRFSRSPLASPSVAPSLGSLGSPAGAFPSAPSREAGNSKRFETPTR